MTNFKLEYYWRGIMIGSELVKAHNEKEVREITKSNKIRFTGIYEKANNTVSINPAHVRRNVVAIEEEQKIEPEKAYLEDKFNWY